MQEFFADYGLWLLIALLVVIGLIFLLSGRKTSDAPPLAEAEPPVETGQPVEKIAAPDTPLPPAASLTTDPVAVTPPPPSPVKAAPAEPAPIIVSPAVTLPAEPPLEGEDDLARLKGVGPKLKTLLTELGVTRFAQIAAWTDTDIAAIDARLGAFKGRPVRDQWVDQAKYLASGDVAGFEARYGKL